MNAGDAAKLGLKTGDIVETWNERGRCVVPLYVTERCMPGVVARVLAEEGQEVAKGTPLLVLTAMKMEHEIRSPRPGRLVKLFREAGERVDSGDPLAEIE